MGMQEEKSGGEVKRNAGKDIYPKENKSRSCHPILLNGKISTDFETKDWRAMQVTAESDHQCATQCHYLGSSEIPTLCFITNQQDKLNI